MLTSFAIDGRLYNHMSHFLHLFFQCLALMGDGKRLFVARRVCKTWKTFIDELKPSEYVEILKAASPNKALVDFLSTHLNPDGLVSLLNESNRDVRHALQKTLRANRPGKRLRGIDPLVWILLHHLVAIAFESARRGKSFSADFTNAWRGYAFYAVFLTCNAPDHQENKRNLRKWWKKTLLILQTRVQASLTNSSLSQQLAAKVSLDSFVAKMLDVTFHSCRPSAVVAVNPFALISHELMASWNWPTSYDTPGEKK